MIKFEHTEVVGWEAAIRGMRNPKNSWDRSDSQFCDNCQNFSTCQLDTDFCIGPNDHKLMETLANGGPVHAKYRRMIAVYVDITAPLYLWKELDTYKVGTVSNSCSTMHKIAAKEFTLDDFSHEHLEGRACKTFNDLIGDLNYFRECYNQVVGSESRKKEYWWQMIQLLPSSYNQRRTVMLNYEVLANIYQMRKDHRLDEWHTFCDWIKTLPYSELITGEKAESKETDIFDENITFEGILKDFEKHHHFLEKHVVDYRPGPRQYTIYIWLDVEHAVTGSREVIYDYKTKECVSAFKDWLWF